jgi:hypothetical protein
MNYAKYIPSIFTKPGSYGLAKYIGNYIWKCPLCEARNRHNLSYGNASAQDMIRKKETRACENWKNCDADYVLGE